MSTRADKPPPPGTWLATCNLQGGPQALSLLSATPEGTAQSAETPAVQVVFSGVLYNRDDLTKALEAAREPTDAQLVARAYERWGEEFPVKLKGIFALALWDRDTRTLLCARDPMGIYPLYYSETSREVVLSTCVDDLVGHPAVSRKLNRPALADHLLHRWPEREETFYEKVSRVVPGHRLRVDQSGRRTERYWDPVPLGQSVNWIREEELGRFGELFVEAVRRCLRHGPAGIFLSGGLDSVSVAAIAADEGQRLGLPSPLALSLVFPDPECNEEAVQRGAARALGLPQQFLSFEAATDGCWLRAAFEMSAGWPMPLLNMWNPAYYRLAAEGHRRGCCAILTGTGGDDWLGISPYLAADLFRELDFRGLWELFRMQQLSFRASNPLLFRNLVWRFGLRPLLRGLLPRLPGGGVAIRSVRALRRGRSRGVPRWLAPDPALRGRLICRAANRVERSHGGSCYLWDVRSCLDHCLTTWEVEEHFENSRRIHAWVRHPFMDADLVDFLCRTPPRWLHRGGRSKGLVRRWLAQRFPALGFERQKKVIATGFFRDTVLAEGPEVWREVGGPKALGELGVVDPRQADLLMDEILVKSPAEAHRIWGMLNIEAWVRPRS